MTYPDVCIGSDVLDGRPAGFPSRQAQGRYGDETQRAGTVPGVMNCGERSARLLAAPAGNPVSSPLIR
ncbi:hypothetical protein [Haloechinothrix alba]|uniref:hypothetical protein n=1 Tax=Haloechinothrix alba TaxID=664784 RepID=UPI0011318C1C|nr:hypothetical protein [Haloechinothrix alba]